MTGVTHIAGLPIKIGDRFIRQRCGWCGAVLVDHDMAMTAVPVGQDPKPATWEVGGLVLVDGALSTSVEHEDGAELPDDACAFLDPTVTV